MRATVPWLRPDSMRAITVASIGASRQHLEELFANSSPCPRRAPRRLHARGDGADLRSGQKLAANSLGDRRSLGTRWQRSALEVSEEEHRPEAVMLTELGHSAQPELDLDRQRISILKRELFGSAQLANGPAKSPSWSVFAADGPACFRRSQIGPKAHSDRSSSTPPVSSPDFTAPPGWHILRALDGVPTWGGWPVADWPS